MYKAILKGIDGYETEKETCIVTISVGQSQHEGEKFRATLNSVLSTFSDAIVAVCDTLQRHTMEIFSVNPDPKAIEHEARIEGDFWLERNLKDYPSQQYKRWDEWLSEKKFLVYKNFIDGLVEEDNYFREALTLEAKKFYARCLKSKKKIIESDCIEKSLNYLKEECAVMFLWKDQGYGFELYPSGRNIPMMYIYNNFIKSPHKPIAVPVSVKFKKRKIENPHVVSL